jgi:hypothetical protein
MLRHLCLFVYAEFNLGMPHGPALCVRRLGTLRGHRSRSRDLTLPPRQ